MKLKAKKREREAFIDGAEWVLKALESIGGGAGRIIGIRTFPIVDLLKQVKEGKIMHVWGNVSQKASSNK